MTSPNGFNRNRAPLTLFERLKKTNGVHNQTIRPSDHHFGLLSYAMILVDIGSSFGFKFNSPAARTEIEDRGGVRSTAVEACCINSTLFDSCEDTCYPGMSQDLLMFEKN